LKSFYTVRLLIEAKHMWPVSIYCLLLKKFFFFFASNMVECIIDIFNMQFMFYSEIFIYTELYSAASRKTK